MYKTIAENLILNYLQSQPIVQVSLTITICIAYIIYIAVISPYNKLGFNAYNIIKELLLLLNYIILLILAIDDSKPNTISNSTREEY